MTADPEVTVSSAHSDAPPAGKKLIGPGPPENSFVGGLALESLAPMPLRIVSAAVDLLATTPILTGVMLAHHFAKQASWYEIVPVWVTAEMQRVWLVTLVVCFCAYTAVATLVFGRTLGQRIAKLKVLATSGRRPGLRSLARGAWLLLFILVCGQCVAILALYYVAAERPGTLPHDALSGTWVVRESVESPTDSTPSSPSG